VAPWAYQPPDPTLYQVYGATIAVLLVLLGTVVAFLGQGAVNFHPGIPLSPLIFATALARIFWGLPAARVTAGITVAIALASLLPHMMEMNVRALMAWICLLGSLSGFVVGRPIFWRCPKRER
jgi:uncharacterized membrane protein